jgi:hypothetical protein
MIFRPWFWSIAVIGWLLLPFALSGLSETRAIAHIFLFVTGQD